MKVLVTGGKGQLGSELHKISINYNFEWLFTSQLPLVPPSHVGVISKEESSCTGQ